MRLLYTEDFQIAIPFSIFRKNSILLISYGYYERRRPKRAMPISRHRSLNKLNFCFVSALYSKSTFSVLLPWCYPSNSYNDLSIDCSFILRDNSLSDFIKAKHSSIDRDEPLLIQEGKDFILCCPNPRGSYCKGCFISRNNQGKEISFFPRCRKTRCHAAILGISARACGTRAVC